MGIINVLDSSNFLKTNNHNIGEVFARLSRRARFNPGPFISNTGVFPAIIGKGKSSNHWK